MKKIVIFANENERAAVSCLRTLSNYNLDIYIAFSDKSIKNLIIFGKYTNKQKSFYYSKDSKEDFIKSLLSIQSEIGDYFVFNFGDKITRWLIEGKIELEENGIQMRSPNLYSYDSMLNKHSFIKCCVKYNLDIPQEISAEVYIKNNLFKEKFVIKAKNSSEGKDNKVLEVPMLIENKKALMKFNKKDIDLEKHFVQQYIDGPSIYYCALYEAGKKKTHFSQKNIVQQPGGKSVIKAVPYQLPIGIIEKIDNMMTELNWDGVMMIEFKESNGRFYAIECNPRFWGPLQLAIDNGINFPAYIVEVESPIQEAVVLKTYGYVWITGYLIGILYKLQTKTSFQLHSKEDYENLNFKDIWFRKDTFLYFIFEFWIILFNQFKKLLV